MKIENASNYRDSVVVLLSYEKLPIADLPATLEDFIVSVENDKVTGAAGLEIYGDCGLLRSLAVDAAYRNKGIAGKLLAQIEGLAGSKKIAALYLLTETASKYFERKGYQQISRAEVPAEIQKSSQFSLVCPQSAIVMKKTI